AAALTALLIFAWGRRMEREKVGWSAAIIFTLSLQTFVHAKAAVADMWLVLFMTLAHWAGYELLYRSDTNTEHRTLSLNNRRFLWWWIFYLSLALGFVAKGPIAWTPLLTVAVVIIYTRDWQLLRHFKFVGGILLTLLTVALWGIPALIQTHGEFFSIGLGRHVIGRSLTTMEGHGAVLSRAPQSTAASRRFLFPTIAITTACVWISIALVIPLMVARFFPAYRLLQVSRDSLQPNMQFAAVEFQEPSLVWYFRSRV